MLNYEKIEELFNAAPQEVRDRIIKETKETKEFTTELMLKISNFVQKDGAVESLKFPLILSIIIGVFIQYLGKYSTAPFIPKKSTPQHAKYISDLIINIRKELQKAEQENNRSLV